MQSCQTDLAVKIGHADQLNQNEKQAVLEQVKNLIPWKKGPFELFGIPIDSEWVCSTKWNRFKNHLGDLKSKTVLDVGCNNGYFMFKLAQWGAEKVIGWDPVDLFYKQFSLLQSFAQVSNLSFEKKGWQDLNQFENDLDIILYMGIIYHHKNPLEQLQLIRRALKKDGKLIIETIGIPGEQPMALSPSQSYAGMKNVYFIPTLNCLINWLFKMKFKNIKVISDTLMTTDEQRNSKFCPRPHKTFIDSLDPNNSTLTCEGYPAPRRFCLEASK